jgi:Ca-activated chloride channel family protein
MPAHAWRFVPVVVLSGGAVLAAQQTFRAGVELVRLPVVVTAKDGRLVRGLDADGFQILEEGRPQKIAYFCEGAPGETLPLHLGLLLDGSESMDQDLNAAANAAVRFVRDLDEATDVTLVDFDSTIHLGRFIPDNYPRLFERIRERKATGGTSLYDALGVFVERMLGETGQQVVLVYTDGGDSTSSMGYGKLQQLLRLGNVMAYVVGYTQGLSSTDRMQQELRLSAIAHETGGEAYFPQSADELAGIYAKILDELSARYTIGYVPADPKADGRFHKVEVKLADPHLRSAKVRTRPGYVAAEAAGSKQRQ